MNAHEAHHMALEAVVGLAKRGIDTHISPSYSRNNDKAVRTFNGPERTSSDTWVSVKFSPTNMKQFKTINKVRVELFKLGMFFPHGSHITANDMDPVFWDLDHNFKYSES